MVKECLEIFLHLDRVVVDLRHAEDPELAILPGPVLLQQEWQQHEEAAVVNDPPNVDGSLDLDQQRDVEVRDGDDMEWRKVINRGEMRKT